MKKVFLIFIIIFSFSALRAQNSDSLYLKRYIQKINIITPGIAGEYLLSGEKNISFNYNLGVKLELQYLERESYYGSIGNYLSIYYFLLLEVRDYISLNKRVSNNRRTDKFSGPYAAFKVEYGKGLSDIRTNYYNDDAYYPYYVVFGPKIGFQRAIGKIWYWDVNAGVGPSLNNHFFTFTFFTSLKFGIAF